MHLSDFGEEDIEISIKVWAASTVVVKHLCGKNYYHYHNQILVLKVSKGQQFFFNVLCTCKLCTMHF